MKIEIEVFWVMTPCRDEVGYQRFRTPCRLHIQCVVMMKMQAAWAPGTLVKNHISTRCHKVEDNDMDHTEQQINKYGIKKVINA